MLPGLAAPNWELDPNWFTATQMPRAIAGGPAVYARAGHGDLAPGKTIESLTESIEALAFRPVYFLQNGRRGEAQTTWFASRHGMVRLSWVNRDDSPIARSVDLHFATTDKKLYDALAEVASALIEAHPVERGSICALVHGEGGLEINTVGVVGVQLARGNYAPDILDAYDHVLADFKTKGPCGRLVVLSGDPGTGKTFLVRGLVQALGNDATCVLVPPHLMAQLGDPSLLPALIEEHKESDGPIVLICEDGDHCLLRRASDNMSSVQSVLNFGDGLMGSMLDLRVLITTNAKVLEMDKAVDRDGRLCRKIAVGALTGHQANAVLSRLVPGRTHWDLKDTITLASVYKYARTIGWTPAEEPDTKGQRSPRLRMSRRR
jgi:hypothetical protein